MFCKNCGSEIDDNAVVCPKCGVATSKSTEKQSNSIAIIGFILSFFIAIAGLVCSIVGYKKSKTLDGAGKGFALAGIIISAAEIIITIIVYVVIIAAAMSVV